VFSLDSVIAAVGMANQTPVMVAAILLAVAVMLLAATPIGKFIDHNPTVKMLALAFIVLVGAYLVAEGFEAHVPKGYIYFAMGFSAVVEVLNLWAKKRASQRMLPE
jgi:predicted tellurium resistance membrane protein TerC